MYYECCTKNITCTLKGEDRRAHPSWLERLLGASKSSSSVSSYSSSPPSPIVDPPNRSGAPPCGKLATELTRLAGSLSRSASADAVACAARAVQFRCQDDRLESHYQGSEQPGCMVVHFHQCLVRTAHGQPSVKADLL